MSNRPARRVALLIEEDFEDRDVVGARDALRAAGLDVVIVGPTAGVTYRSRRGDVLIDADAAAGKTRSRDVDAVVIPGGYAPDRMRMRHAMVDLVRECVDAGKPVAAIDHGAALLISANVVRGRTITCWPSIAIDIKHAGGRYVDRPVVTDGPVITSRKADDLPFFTDAIVQALAARDV